MTCEVSGQYIENMNFVEYKGLQKLPSSIKLFFNAIILDVCEVEMQRISLI